MEKRKARKLSKEELAQKKKVQIKNQRLFQLRKKIRIVLLIGFVLLLIYMLIGVFGSNEFDSKQEALSNKSIPEVKLSLNDLPRLLVQSENVNEVVLTGREGQLKWVEQFGEGVKLYCSAYWTDFNHLEVKLDSSNIDCKANWVYQVEKSEAGTKVTLHENIEMNNVGYRAFLVLNDHLVGLPEIIKVIDGE